MLPLACARSPSTFCVASARVDLCLGDLEVVNPLLCAIRHQARAHVACWRCARVARVLPHTQDLVRNAPCVLTPRPFTQQAIL